MNPYVSHLIAEDRMAQRHAEAAAHRRVAASRSAEGHLGVIRHRVAVALTRLAAAVEPQDAQRNPERPPLVARPAGFRR